MVRFFGPTMGGERGPALFHQEGPVFGGFMGLLLPGGS